MCKKVNNHKTSNTKIDKCMKVFICNLKLQLNERTKVVACCCGHGKYPMTIVVHRIGEYYDLVSGETIPRTRKFYKKDKQGYYYIPEVLPSTSPSATSAEGVE